MKRLLILFALAVLLLAASRVRRSDFSGWTVVTCWHPEHNYVVNAQ